MLSRAEIRRQIRDAFEEASSLLDVAAAALRKPARARRKEAPMASKRPRKPKASEEPGEVDSFGLTGDDWMEGVELGGEGRGSRVRLELAERVGVLVEDIREGGGECDGRDGHALNRKVRERTGNENGAPKSC